MLAGGCIRNSGASAATNFLRTGVKKMAATLNVTKRSLNVSIARGTDYDGNTVVKRYIYSNVKPDVEPDKLLAVGQALGSLFDNEMAGLSITEHADIEIG